MKKLVSLFLALALILSLSVTAFAAGEPYEGHQLLIIQNAALKDGTHAVPCDGTNHVDSCYNYTYIVNETYREILQGEVFTNNSWEEDEAPAGAGSVTDAQILSYLAAQTGGDYGTLRTVAERIYTNIKGKPIAGNPMNETGNVAAGYWLFADVRNLDEQNLANSLIIVDSHRGGTITITPKTGLPTIEKKVKDIADSTDGDINDNVWADSADHDIGDTVPFKLTATLPENLAGYDTYKIIFHDTLSAGLTLDVNSIKVLMYASEEAAEADVDTKNIATNDGATIVTESFSKNTSGLTDGCSFEVSCDDVTAINGVTKDTVFVVYYEATLNTGAVVGETGNPNEVYLEFSNNPYGTGTGETTEDKVIVFTYQLTINKTDADGEALKGAGFTLYKKDATDNYNPIVVGKDADGKTVTELKGADMTTFEWKGLDDGDYKLVETTVPAGYNKMNDIEFTITADHEAETKTLNGGAMGEGDFSAGTITKDVENHTGTVLPETGAKGTLMLITISTMFVMVATVFMVTRKKMSIYED